MTKQELFKTNFVIRGSKSELLEAEKVLQANGISDNEDWNAECRIESQCVIIVSYGDVNERNFYDYYVEDICGFPEYSFQEFMNIADDTPKDYILVNLIGADKEKITLLLETSDHTKITEMVEKAGCGDCLISSNWKVIKARIVK